MVWTPTCIIENEFWGAVMRPMGVIARSLGVAVGVVCLVLLLTPAAHADDASLLDPPVFVGNPTNCPNSGVPPCSFLYLGSEVIGIGATSLTIYDQGAASKTMGDPNNSNNPILLIIGVPNATNSFVAPGISSVSVTRVGGSSGSGTPTGQLGGTNVFAGSWNTSTGYSGQLKTGTIYDVIGLTDKGDGSQSWVNWSAADLAVLNITVNPSTGFALFVYSITGASLGQGDYFTVNFTGSGLPIGTFTSAYGCETGGLVVATSGPAKKPPTGLNKPAPPPVGACDPVGNVYSTPFTHAGLVDNKVPEPTSMLLFGSGLIGLAGLIRRKLSR